MKKKYILIFSGLLCIDLVLKYLIMSLGNFVVIRNFLSFIYIKNTGAAFSILEGRSYLFIILTIIAIVSGILYLRKNTLKNYEYILVSIVSAGIIGNLYDRVVFGYVRDFISFKIFNYNAAIFNFADMCIVLGIIVYVILLIKEDLCKLKKKKLEE